VYLAPTVVEPGGIQMHECAGCRGIFIAPSAWSTMFNLVEAGEPVGVGRFVPLKPGAAAPALLDLVHCPSCNGEMDRAAFAARSRIIIDICSAHGVWLDAAELAPVVLHFQRLERGEIEEEPSSVRSPEAQSLLAEIAAAEKAFDRHYDGWKDAEENRRAGWGMGHLGDDVKIAHRHLRELRERLAAIRAVERAALKAREDAPE
jgi:Zn-finger nucleic acid-binding protein